MLQSLILSILSQSSLTPTTLLRYVRLPLFYGDYCMVTSGQRQRTSVPQHGQRLRFRPCTLLIAHPMPHPAGILGHNGCADVLRMLAGCGLQKERQSLSVIFAFTQFSFSHHPIKVPAVFLPIFWLMPLCSQAYRQARAWARKAHISQFASCFDTELRLCLNNLYLPPDIRIDIIWVPGTAAFHTRSEAP